MGYRRAGVACLPSILLPDEVAALRNCSICGVESRLHSIEPQLVPLLPRRTPPIAFCEVPNTTVHDQTSIHRPPTSDHLMRRYAHSREAARRASLDTCVCTVHGTGVPETIEHRHFPNGLGHVSHLCGFDGVRGANSENLFWPLPPSRGVRVGTAEGGKHLVMAGVMHGEQGRGSTRRPAIIRIAMKQAWHSEHANLLEGCKVVQPIGSAAASSSQRIVCDAAAAEASYRATCTDRLGVPPERDPGYTRGIDLPTQAALGGIDGFPELLGGGCCVYELPLAVGGHNSSGGGISSSARERDASTSSGADAWSASPDAASSLRRGRLLILPIELRGSFFPHERDRQGQMQLVDVDTPVQACVDGGLSDAQCTLRRVLLSARFMRALHESSHRLILGEHTSAQPPETCSELTQLCWDGHTGQLALCDTDFIALTPAGGRPPLPFASSVSDRAWGAFRVGRASARSVLIDMPCAFGRSVLAPMRDQGLKFLAPLVDELLARNALLARGAEVAQLSFSCIEAWVAAAAVAHGIWLPS